MTVPSVLSNLCPLAPHHISQSLLPPGTYRGSHLHTSTRTSWPLRLYFPALCQLEFVIQTVYILCKVFWGVPPIAAVAGTARDDLPSIILLLCVCGHREMTINKRKCDERVLKGGAWRGCTRAENHVKLATMVGGGVLSSSKTNDAG